MDVASVCSYHNINLTLYEIDWAINQIDSIKENERDYFAFPSWGESRDSLIPKNSDRVSYL